jgi:hypothetical protein
MKTKPYAPSILLALNGIILMGLGLYFVFIRPPLLPEDPRFMGTTLADIQISLPGLLTWLRRVLWVMGGFMFATGLLLLYIAQTTFRTHSTGTRIVISLAALSSIGWMAVVNFLIDSDFKWLIFAFNLPWIASLVLSLGERRNP